MAHLFQVGAGSGGMPVLDMIGRDPRITRITLVEPDIYKPHNVERHLFDLSSVGHSKAELARQWLLRRRPDLEVQILIADITDPNIQGTLHEIAEDANVGVCAADNEVAKFHWDRLMRQHRLPWTLGEVLSGGIGGFVHTFTPTGACYGCVASHLQRSVTVDTMPKPDYSAPGGPIWETTIPASKASISVIASLHALETIALLDVAAEETQSNTLLFGLTRVPGIFDETYRPYRFRISRGRDCLICQARPTPSSMEELDVALDQALERLVHE